MVATESYLQSQEFRRLSQTIQSGECVLFLGAGVSLDSGAPDGQGLADELGQKFFDVPPKTYSLDMACQLTDANEGRSVLNEYLLDRFRCLEPAGALLSIPHFKWKSIYTVNIDLLLEAAYARTPDRLQDLHPFYSDKDSLARLHPNEVPLYKLHGCLSRANSDDGYLTMTQEDFARVEDSRQRLLNRLLDDASDFTIFYVGFGRQDSDFTRVRLGVKRAAGQLMGPRRSYALQPGYTEPEARRWEQESITLIDAKAANFFTALESHLPLDQRFVTHADEKQTEIAPLIRRKPKVTTELLVEIRRNFEVIDESIRVQEPNTDDFLRGSPPNWGAIAADADAPRDLKNEILDPILHEPALDRGEAQFVLLHTEAGTGKTTLLRRLGVELALTWDHIVISLKPYGDLEFLDLERLAQLADERIYVLVDDASSQAREISEALSRARHANIKLTILAAARTNEWREIQEGYSFPGFSDFAFEALSDEEIDAIISTLAKHNALGLLAGASREAQIAAFKSKADKQLLVALREATEGKAFDDIVVDEYDRIPSPAGQRAYLLVAALHRLGILTRAGLLHRALNLPLADLGHQVFDPTTKVIVPRDALGESEHYYSTRHQLIAEIVFDRKIGSERRRVEYYADLIGHLDLGYSSDADAYRKLTRSRNKQFLRDFDDVNNRRELMQQLVHIDPTDAFALQHAAMMELDQGNVGPASKYLNRALELRPNDPSIRDTEGRLVLMNANSEQNLYIADGKFARAEEIFTRNIQRRRDEPFGYRHLAETYINWADRQERDGKRLHYISLAYGTLLEGLNKCTSASMLLQYLGELEEKIGNPDKARQSFTHALQGKPGDIITRFMAARLEEKQGDSERALQLLEEGLEVSSAEPELHFDELVVTNKERFEPRRFRFGLLREHHTGRVSRVSYASASVEFDQGATEIYLPMRQIAGNIAQGLQVNRLVSYEIRFNMKGAVGVSISLAG